MPDALLDWLGIRGMRNRLVHGYDSIDLQIVHATITRRLPELVAQLTAALTRL